MRPIQPSNLVRLSSILLLSSAAMTAAQTPPPPPVDLVVTRQVESEGPPPRQSADREVHPEEQSGAFGAVAGDTVLFSEIAVEPPQALRSGPSRAHIQGSPSGSGPGRERIVPLPDREFSNPPSPAPNVWEEWGGALRAASSGNVERQFDGLAETGWIPPDTVVAVGTSHVLEATNSGFAIYNKLGTQLQGYTTFANLFNGLTPSGWTGFFFDPRVMWANFKGKYVMLILGRDDNAQTSHIFIAISQTSNPLGAWWRWRFNQDAGNAGDSNSWLDYASLGADDWGIYAVGNLFEWSDDDFKYAKLFTFNPAMWTGGATNGWAFWDLKWTGLFPSKAFSLQVAYPGALPGADETFLVNTHSGSGSDVLLWTLTGDRTNNPSLAKEKVDVADYDAIQANVDQPGSATDLDGGDARVMNVVYRQRRVYLTWTTDVNDDGQAGGVWVSKINVDSGNQEWSHLLWGGNGRYYFYPAITLDADTATNPNLAVFYSFTRSSPSPTYFASSGYKVYTNHPTNADGANVLNRLGQNWYVDLDDASINRWGDYSGAAFDFQCDHAWGATEYAGSTNSDWVTRIAAVNIDNEPPCRLIAITAPNGGQTLVAGQTYLVSWDRAHLDPAHDVYVYYDTGTGSSAQSGPLSTFASSWLWTVPNEPAAGSGKVWVGAWDGADWDTGDWSDGNFSVLGRPDLVANGVGGPSSAAPGETVSLSYTVSNSGSVSAGAFSLGIYLSTNATCTTGDTLLLSRSLSSLNDGSAQGEATFDEIPVGATPGTQYLCLIVDRFGAVAEFNENNNIALQPITITEPPIFVDGFESGDISAWNP